MISLSPPCFRANGGKQDLGDLMIDNIKWEMTSNYVSNWICSVSLADLWNIMVIHLQLFHVVVRRYLKCYADHILCKSNYFQEGAAVLPKISGICNLTPLADARCNSEYVFPKAKSRGIKALLAQALVVLNIGNRRGCVSFAATTREASYHSYPFLKIQ